MCIQQVNGYYSRICTQHIFSVLVCCALPLAAREHRNTSSVCSAINVVVGFVRSKFTYFDWPSEAFAGKQSRIVKPLRIKLLHETRKPAESQRLSWKDLTSLGLNMICAYRTVSLLAKERAPRWKIVDAKFV